jgi:hypothetical protein
MHHAGHYKALADAAGVCVAKEQVCVNHCLDPLGSGDQGLPRVTRACRKCFLFAMRYKGSPTRTPAIVRVSPRSRVPENSAGDPAAEPLSRAGRDRGGTMGQADSRTAFPLTEGLHELS